MEVRGGCQLPEKVKNMEYFKEANWILLTPIYPIWEGIGLWIACLMVEFGRTQYLLDFPR